MPPEIVAANRPRLTRQFRKVLAVLIFILSLGTTLGLRPALAQQVIGRPSIAPAEITPLRTDSPRDLLSTFLSLRDDMEAALVDYTTRNSQAGATRLSLLSDKMVALFDLQEVPSVARREVGIATATYLMDIFGRIDPPVLTDVPDQAALESEGVDYYRIAGTPLRINLMTTGEREGEFLFSASTVQAAPRFLRGLMDKPLRTPLEIASYSAFSPQLTGPLIPAAIVRSMPPSLKTLWFGTPAWKVLAIALFGVISLIIIARLHRGLEAVSLKGRVVSLVLRATLPLTLIVLVTFALPYLSHQINISGEFANGLEKGRNIVGHAAYAWLFWLAVRMGFEWLILSPRIPDESLDANLLRLVAGVIGIIGSAVILAFGGQAIGLPILSVLAGLGIGGLAVALALRPTLENLVGGVILYVDRPVRVGDFCSFEGQTGTVEGIGIRSTKLRALDRTLITVPNAQFADMQIVNFASCDKMLINEVVGVRYETEPDQLRYLLARLRELLVAHPKTDSDTVRVRFSSYGSSALNIDIRVYVTTVDWNEFFAIREDLFLRILDVVKEAGTAFAFPSQTLYLTQDGGMDGKRVEAASATVESWRQNGKLPFPHLPRTSVEGLDGTLDYPPNGSFAAGDVPRTTTPNGADATARRAEAQTGTAHRT